MFIDEEGYKLDDAGARVGTEDGGFETVEVGDGGVVLSDTGEPAVDDDGNEVLAELFTPDDGEKETDKTTEDEVRDQMDDDTGDSGAEEGTEEEDTPTTDIDARLAELEKKNSGLVSDLQSEREKRRELDETLKSIQKPEQPRQFKSEEERQQWLNDMPSRMEVMQAMQMIEERALEMVRPLREEASLEKARAKHTDYDDVADLAEELISKNPAYSALVKTAEDPHEQRYNIGKLHPNYTEKIREAARQEVTKKLKSNTPTTTAGVSGGGKSSDIDLAAAVKLLEKDPGAFDNLPKETQERLLGTLI